MNKTETIQVLGHIVEWESDIPDVEWSVAEISEEIAHGVNMGEFAIMGQEGTISWRVINPLQEELDRVQGELDHYKEQYYKIHEVDNQIVLKLVEKIKQWKEVAGDMYEWLSLYIKTRPTEDKSHPVHSLIKQYEKLRDNAI